MALNYTYYQLRSVSGVKTNIFFAWYKLSSWLSSEKVTKMSNVYIFTPFHYFVIHRCLSSSIIFNFTVYLILFTLGWVGAHWGMGWEWTTYCNSSLTYQTSLSLFILPWILLKSNKVWCNKIFSLLSVIMDSNQDVNLCQRAHTYHKYVYEVWRSFDQHFNF